MALTEGHDSEDVPTTSASHALASVARAFAQARQAMAMGSVKLGVGLAALTITAAEAAENAEMALESFVTASMIPVVTFTPQMMALDIGYLAAMNLTPESAGRLAEDVAIAEIAMAAAHGVAPSPLSAGAAVDVSDPSSIAAAQIAAFGYSTSFSGPLSTALGTPTGGRFGWTDTFQLTGRPGDAPAGGASPTAGEPGTGPAGNSPGGPGQGQAP